jgi:hypothetical protein
MMVRSWVLIRSGQTMHTNTIIACFHVIGSTRIVRISILQSRNDPFKRILCAQINGSDVNNEYQTFQN